MEWTAYIQPVSKLCFPLLMQRKHWHRIPKGSVANNSSSNFNGLKEDGKWSCNPYSFTLVFTETWSRNFSPCPGSSFQLPFIFFCLAVSCFPSFHVSSYCQAHRSSQVHRERGSKERESERETKQTAKCAYIVSQFCKPEVKHQTCPAHQWSKSLDQSDQTQMELRASQLIHWVSKLN